MSSLVEKAALHPSRVSDDDIAAIVASGLSEDQVFELVLSLVTTPHPSGSARRGRSQFEDEIAIAMQKARQAAELPSHNPHR